MKAIRRSSGQREHEQAVISHAHWPFGLRPRLHELVTDFYWVAAAILLPWVVLLYLWQPARGDAHHLPATTVGIATILVAVLLWAAWTCHRRTPSAVMAASFAGTLSLVTMWFHFVTGTASGGAAVGAATAFVLAGAAVLSAWTATRLQDRRGRHEGRTGWASIAYLVGAIVLAGAIPRLAARTPSTHPASHLRLVWVGLDVAELVALAATAWTLRYRSSRVVVAATSTATLLLCDAWFNVTASTGAAQLSAVAMACVEIPLAGLSLAIARHEVRYWYRDQTDHGRQIARSSARPPIERGQPRR